MIRLTKGTKPEILERLASTWTQVILDRLQGGERPTDAEKARYRHPEVKARLVAETHGKCAYCESKLLHITHGDIDHIVPKSAAPEKSFEWENLTLACDKCNENKSDHFGNHDDLVDPYIVEPSEHFFFEGPLFLPIPGSDPALLTETILKLNRSELLERRKEKIRYLAKSLDALARIQSEELRAIVRRDLLEQEIRADQEFAALARHFVERALAIMDRAIAARANSEKIP